NTPFSSLAGQQISYDMAADTTLDRTNPALSSQLGEFLLLVRQLAFEFNAFGSTGEAARLYQKLNGIYLNFVSNSYTRPAGEFLKAAKEALIDGDGRSYSRTVVMPDAWPTITATTEDELWDVIIPAMNARLATIIPQEGRFDGLT